MRYFAIQLNPGDKSVCALSINRCRASLNNVCIRLAAPQKWTAAEREILHVNLSRWFPRGENLVPLPEAVGGGWSVCRHGTARTSGGTWTELPSHTLQPERLKWAQSEIADALASESTQLRSATENLTLPPLHFAHWRSSFLSEHAAFPWFPAGAEWFEVTSLQKMTIRRKNEVMKLRNSISALLAIHLPALVGRGFIIWSPSLSLHDLISIHCIPECVSIFVTFSCACEDND